MMLNRVTRYLLQMRIDKCSDNKDLLKLGGCQAKCFRNLIGWLMETGGKAYYQIMSTKDQSVTTREYLWDLNFVAALS